MSNEEKMLAMLENLTAGFAHMQADITHMQADISQMKTDISQAQANIAELMHGQAKLEQGQAKLEQGQAKLEQGQANLEQEVRTIKDRFILMEHENKQKITALFDAYSMLYDISCAIRADVTKISSTLDKHDFYISWFMPKDKKVS